MASDVPTVVSSQSHSFCGLKNKQPWDEENEEEKSGCRDVHATLLTSWLLQVPHRHPTKPLIICPAQSSACRTLATIRVMNRLMLNFITFFGSLHRFQISESLMWPMLLLHKQSKTPSIWQYFILVRRRHLRYFNSSPVFQRPPPDL